MEKPESDKVPSLHAIDAVFHAATIQQEAGVAAHATIEIDSTAASARTTQLVEAAEAVADTILITPALVRGDGEVTIRLKPTVLDGSEIHIEAKGADIKVSIAPTTYSAQQIVEQSQTQLAQTLAERLPSFQFTIMISPRPMTTRKGPSHETT